MDLKLNFKNISFEGRGKVFTFDEAVKAGSEATSYIKKIVIEEGNEEIPDNYIADFIVQKGGEILGKLKAKTVNFIGGTNFGIQADDLNVCCAVLKGDNFVADTAKLYGGSVLEGNLSVKNALYVDSGAKLLSGSKTNVDGDTFVLGDALIEGKLNTKTLEVAGQPCFSETSDITVNSEKINPKRVLKVFRKT